MAESSFDTRVDILAEIWMNDRENEDLEDYIKYNDLGLPLAYCIQSGIIEEVTDAATDMIDESFHLLLDTLGLEDDDWSSAEELLEAGLGYYELDIPLTNEEEDEEDTTATESYEAGYKDGSLAEQKRVQEICGMQMTWAKQSNKGNDFMQWHNVSELLKPINFEYSEEEYRKSLEQDGF